MKLISKIFMLFAFAGLLFTACKKDEALPVYSESTTTVLSASASVVTPTPADSNKTVLTMSWTDPNLNVVTSFKSYVLEIDSTGKNFVNAKKVVASPDSLKKLFTGTELNKILLNLGFLIGTAYKVDIRLTTSYGNNNDLKKSNIVTITATPYKVPPKVDLPTSGELYLIGSATVGSWSNPVPVPSQQFSRVDETTFMGVFDLTPGSYLCLPVNGSWADKYGFNGSNDANNTAGDNLARGGGDIAAPATAGKYVITVDFQYGKFTCVPYTGALIPMDLFIVGGATPGGWNNPVPTPAQQFTKNGNCLFEIASLNLNSANGMYLLLPVNGSWSDKYGGVGANNGSNNPLEDDFKQGGSDLAAPTTAGNYKISVNFATGKYKLTKL